MKATSIEQIREHLARGGEAIGHVETACKPHDAKNRWPDKQPRDLARLLALWRICGRVEQVFPDDDILVVCPAGEWKGAHSVWRFDQASYWELLPIEEEPLTGIDAKALPILTEDPTGESRRKTPQILIDGNDTGAGERIRKALLFGHYPAMNDLIAWWQATTGERIEWGRRCDECDGEGNVDTGLMELTHPAKPHVRKCPKCINHPGYTVRPTWMEEVKG